MKKRSPSTKKVLVPEVLPAQRKTKGKGTRSTSQEEALEDSEELESDEIGSEETEPDEIQEEEIHELAHASSQLPALTSPHTELTIPPDAVAPSISDPLRRYFEDIRRYPLLDPEEEFRLAMKLKNDGDVNAAKTLVSANLRLVVKIAMEYRTYYSNLLDLIQEGNVGLMKAVSKFDPTKGARLGYYASWWIRSYILKYLLDNFRLVKIGTTQAQKKLFYHLMREKERMEAQGLIGAPRLLAEKLQVREKDIVEMEQRLSGRGAEVSLDAPIDSDGGKAHHLDQLVDLKENPDDVLGREQLLSLLRKRLPEFRKKLKDKELSILEERLLAESPKTLQEVADKYGLTRERARQIEVQVIEKLKTFLGPRFFT